MKSLQNKEINSMLKYIDKKNYTLIWILLFGLIIRLTFSFYLSKYYYGDVRFVFGDSFSYVNSFLNLLNYGVYTFELNNIDAHFYRGPIYPFFWGAHYILVGSKYSYEAVAVTQCIIDTLSGFLVYKILNKSNVSYKYSVAGLIVYLLNPLNIVHVPITGTETIAIFITLLVLYLTLKSKNINNWMIVGGLCGVAVMTRQYLGLLLPVTILYVLTATNINLNGKIKRILIILFGFSFIVSPWFLRNAINHQVPTILMGKTTGYSAYQEDYIAFNKFYTLFYVDITPVFKEIANTGVDENINSEIFNINKNEVRNAAQLAFKCGPSFEAWRSEKNESTMKESCKEEVEKKYNELKKKYVDENNIMFYLKVPLLNLQKAVFKNQLTNVSDGWNNIFYKIIFNIRSIMVCIALFGFFFLPWNRLNAFMLFPIILIFYISFVVRQVEMRYLVQADSVLMIFAIVVIYRCVDKININNRKLR